MGTVESSRDRWSQRCRSKRIHLLTESRPKGRGTRYKWEEVLHIGDRSQEEEAEDPVVGKPTEKNEKKNVSRSTQEGKNRA